MPLLSGIYDSGPIAPVCKIKENLSIFSLGLWSHYNVSYIEPMPRSSPMIAELVTISGATVLAANGAIAQQVINILTLRDKELLHLRWEPLDDVEGVLWEQSGTGRFVTRGVHARVSIFSQVRDPYLSTTTFWILGRDRNMNLEVRNPNPVATPIARFVFWGYRYMLVELPGEPAVTTYLPAEGWGGGA